MRSTYVVGRVTCSGLTAVLLAEVLSASMSRTAGTALAVVGTVLFIAPLSDIAAAFTRERSDRLGPALATYLRPFELLFLPLSALLGLLSRRLTARIRPTAEELVDPEGDLELKKSIISAEVEFMVDQGEKSGVVGAEPAAMFRNVLGFAELAAKDIMVPRHRVEGIEVKTPLSAVRRLVAESGHSRYPVYDGQLDNVVGILCAKDVFKIDGSASPEPEGTAADVLRPETFFVHESQSLASMLREMRVKRHHLAVVVDEFGGTSGIVTLEDVLEKIVGDIRDEHDEAADAAPIQDLGDGRLFANPDVSMGDLSAYLGAPIPEDAHDEPLRDVLKRHSDRPEVGTSIEKYGLQFIVRDMDGSDVQRVEVVRPAATSSA
jgi:magnesium and cobalt transporter